MAQQELDVYVFLKDANDKILHKLEHLQPVRCIATLSGPYEAFAVATLDGFHRLEHFLERLRGLGDPPTAVVLQPSFVKIVHSPRPPVLAFIQLWAQPGKVEDLFKKTSSLGPKHLGSSIVAGDFDVLVEVGGESFEEVTEALLDKKKGLASLPGLVRSTTSFGFIRYYRKPQPKDANDE
jgi:hypothetical protein